MSRCAHLVLALAVATLDQWSKWLVELHLPRYSSLPVLPGFDLTHVRNTGVAFGLFPARGELVATALLTGVGLVALAVILVSLWRTPADEPLLRTALALVLGGAVGNLIDRLAAGAVTDFVDLHAGDWHFHTFNLADVAITLGVAALAVELLRPRRGAAERGDHGGPTATA